MVTSLLPGVPGWVVREQLARAAGADGDGGPEDAAPRCLGETAGGRPCTAFRLTGSLFCRHHDPEAWAGDDEARAARARQREADREARVAERRAEAWAARLESPAQLRAFVAAVTRAAWDRRIDPETAGACLDGARLLAELCGTEGRP
jgi:hypothetical protein